MTLISFWRIFCLPFCLVMFVYTQDPTIASQWVKQELIEYFCFNKQIIKVQAKMCCVCNQIFPRLYCILLNYLVLFVEIFTFFVWTENRNKCVKASCPVKESDQTAEWTCTYFNIVSVL